MEPDATIETTEPGWLDGVVDAAGELMPIVADNPVAGAVAVGLALVIVFMVRKRRAKRRAVDSGPRPGLEETGGPR